MSTMRAHGLQRCATRYETCCAAHLRDLRSRPSHYSTTLLYALTVCTYCALAVHLLLTYYSLTAHLLLTYCSLAVHSLCTHCSLTVRLLFTCCALTVHSLLTYCALAVHSLLTYYSCTRCLLSVRLANNPLPVHHTTHTLLGGQVRTHFRIVRPLLLRTLARWVEGASSPNARNLFEKAYAEVRPLVDALVTDAQSSDATEGMDTTTGAAAGEAAGAAGEAAMDLS